MKKNVFPAIFMITTLTILLYGCTAEQKCGELQTFGTTGSIPAYSIEDKIFYGQIIVIGEVKTTLPSKWVRQEEKDAQDACPEEILETRGGLFTDSIISVERVLKGDYQESTVRVRTFKGETEHVIWEASGEPSYEKGHRYLLFLRQDFGPTSGVDPGDYISANADAAVYEIVDGKAISGGEEWVLEELIALIEKCAPLRSPLCNSDMPLQPSTDTYSNPPVPILPGDSPFIGGKDVTFQEAQALTDFHVPQLEGVAKQKVRVQTWGSADSTEPVKRSVAIQFENDILLIIHSMSAQPDWDGMIAQDKDFVKVFVNGIPGIGAEPGVEIFNGEKFYRKGSVVWWVDRLKYGLYTDTVPLEELLKVAESLK